MSDVVPESRKYKVVGGEPEPANAITPATFALLQDKVRRLEYSMYNPDGIVQPIVKDTDKLKHGHTAQVTAIAVVTFVLGLVSCAAAVIALVK